VNGARNRASTKGAAVKPTHEKHLEVVEALPRKSRAERFAEAHAAVLTEHAETFAKLAK